MEWFVHDGKERIGPISGDALRTMLSTGAVASDILVWRTGMDKWMPASTVPGLGSPPPVPSAGHKGGLEGVARASDAGTRPAENDGIGPSSAQDEVMQHTPREHEDTSRPIHGTQPATPWRRYWARMLDLTIFAMLVGIVIGIVAPSAFMPDGMFGTPGGEHLLNWICLPIAMIIEGVVLGLFGGTPGKALAGISVTGLRGAKPSVADAITRNIQIWWYGLGTGFPLVSLFTLIVSYRKVASGQPARWELSTGLRSYARGGAARTIVTALVFLSLMFGVLLLGDT